ncbi:class I SAM-dependent methyltransferase [Planosporangium mesophilum]|uniref:SAM-dependent methyltransferase n=1 Tax=Planosporangium mesophilum TaxID=689768 RepID=A0A8J3X453_9ACTN|nr:class I SAM-dependent methyltransferase [Planosporangium mesophilum]NJC82009.1 class I SAM-dependent methyltransferase [Planosporangium mesophilum]GII26254.1 SAM-dependent methyltransferase [Planosporangium mesophilum]
MEASARQAQARSFGPAADLYDRVRPRYPIEAIRWILGDRPLTVVDLGAGTGILTRQLVGIGYEPIPVEPDPGMRRRLGETGGAPDALDGSAEAIPLPDASVDAVVAGQAYHWFDHERAHAEIARVLKPGGVFGPLWNDRDDQVPWIAALSEIVDDDQSSGVQVAPLGPLFTPLEQATFRHAVRQTPQTLLELVRSRSFYLTAAPARRAEVDTAVRELCATHPDLAGRDEFDLPYVTYAFRARRAS